MSVEILHKALLSILDRDRAVVESRELIDKWSPCLQEYINYATHLLARCEKSLKGIEGTPSALIYIYYHIIQMADGIEILCSKGCASGTIPLQRSLWEGLISIDYMLKEDFELRSTAWMACCHLDSKRFHEKLDPTTKEGKRVEELRKQDPYLARSGGWNGIDPAKIEAQIRLYVSTLNKPKFVAALSHMKSGHKDHRKWFAVNGGADSIYKIAKCLGRELQFHFLYSYYSAVSHAKDSSRMISSDGKRLFIEPLRFPKYTEDVYMFTRAFLLDATMLIADKLRPSETTKKDLNEIQLRHWPEKEAVKSERS